VLMATSSFYEDRRYCSACERYTHYLQSPSAAYCSRCGELVRLFSPVDLARFRSSLRLDQPPRPRTTRDSRATA